MQSRIFVEKKIQYKELALALEAAEKHAEVSGSSTAAVTVADSTVAVAADEPASAGARRALRAQAQAQAAEVQDQAAKARSPRARAHRFTSAAARRTWRIDADLETIIVMSKHKKVN